MRLDKRTSEGGREVWKTKFGSDTVDDTLFIVGEASAAPVVPPCNALWLVHAGR